MTSPISSSTANINDLMKTMNTKAQESADGVQADTDKFMTLLVTQLQNQDPLNPMDNAQMTSQLAQLQTVTGVNKLNTTLESLKASYQSSESLAATNLIGHGVLVEGNGVQLAKGQAILGVELASPADKVQLVVSDAGGNEVATIDLGAQEAGIVPVAWDGVPDAKNVDAEGKPIALADGKYTFKVVATQGGEAVTDAKSLSFDSVASVTTGGKDGVKLNLPGAGAVAYADIKQVL
ncbi:flagellar hook assembly protein FlgD [Massilia sp. YIM B02443]|uniref:flagellar hook assembly protein FlgD n=1 Tax=Massilia sp. YIM B02443 TaxID=3050127 RepID=UPI0025B665F8|nr:flagellar hook assembly protein FlgD [Massilia sp. YIM B02443]MDN4035745.1 flagellar hook assembly protein FlgD [Massilia sp. YIM B02443]